MLLVVQGEGKQVKHAISVSNQPARKFTMNPSSQPNTESQSDTPSRDIVPVEYVNSHPVDAESFPLPHGGSVRCHAHSRSGETCKRAPAAGQSVCASHGAKSPRAIHGAKVRLAEANARQFVQSHGIDNPETDVNAALMNLLSEVAAGKEYLSQKLADLRAGAGDPADEASLVAAYERTLDRNVKTAVAIAKLGVPQAIRAGRGADMSAMSQCLNAALLDEAANLSDQQRQAFRARLTLEVDRHPVFTD